jgi:hypothetical protein
MNSLTFTGVVTKEPVAKDLGQGLTLNFHVASGSGAGRGDLWFMVSVNGREAERVEDEIWRGQVVTVFGAIELNPHPIMNAITVRAKKVIPHIREADDESEAA